MAVLRSIHKGFGILYFNTKTYIFGVHPQVTAAATAATEEFSSSTSPHPITHRDTISRSDHSSLRPMRLKEMCESFLNGAGGGTFFLEAIWLP